MKNKKNVIRRKFIKFIISVCKFIVVIIVFYLVFQILPIILYPPIIERWLLPPQIKAMFYDDNTNSLISFENESPTEIYVYSTEKSTRSRIWNESSIYGIYNAISDGKIYFSTSKGLYILLANTYNISLIIPESSKFYVTQVIPTPYSMVRNTNGNLLYFGTINNHFGIYNLFKGETYIGNLSMCNSTNIYYENLSNTSFVNRLSEFDLYPLGGTFLGTVYYFSRLPSPRILEISINIDYKCEILKSYLINDFIDGMVINNNLLILKGNFGDGKIWTLLHYNITEKNITKIKEIELQREIGDSQNDEYYATFDWFPPRFFQPVDNKIILIPIWFNLYFYNLTSASVTKSIFAKEGGFYNVVYSPTKSLLFTGVHKILIYNITLERFENMVITFQLATFSSNEWNTEPTLSKNIRRRDNR